MVDKSNPNSNSAQNQQTKQDPIVTAKSKCKESCDKELANSKKQHSENRETPTKNEFALYTKKNINDNIEYYLCECLLSSDNRVVQKEFYFANKMNVDMFFKNDDDGRKVYKKTLKKGLSDSDNSIYQIVN
jgi:DNA-binding response OmpR family regulator